MGTQMMGYKMLKCVGTLVGRPRRQENNKMKPTREGGDFESSVARTIKPRDRNDVGRSRDAYNSSPPTSHGLHYCGQHALTLHLVSRLCALDRICLIGIDVS